MTKQCCNIGEVYGLEKCLIRTKESSHQHINMSDNGHLLGFCSYSELYFFRSAMASSLISQQHNLIIKSPEDKREYRGLLLKNGMKVLLISDPTTDKSSAAMDVNIGKFFFKTYNLQVISCTIHP